VTLKSTLDYHPSGNILDEAKHYCHKLVPDMLAVREATDTLEGVVADDLWPLPTYQEMLFIK
jgi:glutamine synthetase